MPNLDQIRKEIKKLEDSQRSISRIGDFNYKISYYGLMFSEDKVEIINLYQQYESRKDTKFSKLEYYDVTDEFNLCKQDFLSCIKKIRKKYKPHERCKRYLKK